MILDLVYEDFLSIFIMSFKSWDAKLFSVLTIYFIGRTSEELSESTSDFLFMFFESSGFYIPLLHYSIVYIVEIDGFLECP